MRFNAKGFSLVEIMMVAGGLAGLALVGMNMMEQQSKSQVTAEVNFERLEFRRKLSNLIAQKKVCDVNFQNLTIGSQLAMIKNSANVPVIEVNKVYGNNSLKVKSLSTVLVKDNSDGTFDIDLVLDFEKTKQMAMGKNTRIRFPLMVTAANAGAPISSCLTNEGLWALDSENIYNTNSLNVGIGTATPGAKLDVAGGGIRPGSETEVTACGMGRANGEGIQRYNYTTHMYEYCNGTGWVAMGGGGEKFGGMYSTNTFKGYSCKTVNPVTGACNCPPGYNGMLSGQAYRNKQWDETILVCVKP